LRHWIMKGLSPKSFASSFLKSLLAFGYDKVENQAKRSHGSNHQSNKKACNQTISNLYLYCLITVRHPNAVTCSMLQQSFRYPARRHDCDPFANNKSTQRPYTSCPI
jgi:hypothetical protein